VPAFSENPRAGLGAPSVKDPRPPGWDGRLERFNGQKVCGQRGAVRLERAAWARAVPTGVPRHDRAPITTVIDRGHVKGFFRRPSCSSVLLGFFVFFFFFFFFFFFLPASPKMDGGSGIQRRGVFFNDLFGPDEGYVVGAAHFGRLDGRQPGDGLANERVQHRRASGFRSTKGGLATTLVAGWAPQQFGKIGWRGTARIRLGYTLAEEGQNALCAC